jgi:amino acid transporter
MSNSPQTPEPRDARDFSAPASDGASAVAHASGESTRTLRDDVHAREKAEFGGFKFGSAFFGWLTAMGTTVLLTALATAIGAAMGIGSDTSPEEAADSAMGPLGIVAAVVIGLVLLVAYYAGGYVAGRMARFSGAKQGIAVWIWAVVIAIIVAVVTAIAGSQWDILGNLQGFPRIPVTPETATLTGILTALGAAVVTLIGAILGGLAGMRFHRKVDRVGLGR